MEEREGKIDIPNTHSIKEKGGITHQSPESIKEFNCLHNINHEIEACKTLKDLLPRIIHHTAQGMQFPHIASSFITLDGETYGTQPNSSYR